MYKEGIILGVSFLLVVISLARESLFFSLFSPRRKQQGVSQSLASFVLRGFFFFSPFFFFFDVLEHDGGIFQSLEEAFLSLKREGCKNM